jgi:hypothetical protein
MGVEVKNSLVLKKHDCKTSWCFALSQTDIDAYHREGASEQEKERLKVKLYDALYVKMQGGGCAIFTARCDAHQLAQYQLDGVFVAYYCVTKALKHRSGTVNLGSVVCKQCGHYHRMLLLQEFAAMLSKHIAARGGFDIRHNYWTAEEAKRLFDTQVSSQCKK